MSLQKKTCKTKPKEGRYIILFEKGTASNVKKVQNELQVKFTSSAELSGNVKAEDVLKADKGLYFKNLGVAVVDDVETAHLIQAANTNLNNIIYWEPEQIFQTAIDPLQHIKNIRAQITAINKELKALEQQLKKPNNEINPKVDPIKSTTWGLQTMNLLTQQYTGAGVDVCILDTGFYAAHPDFVGRNVVGKSFVPNQAWDFDGDGHGTHCTGTAVGYYNTTNGMRYGVAHQANIGIGKVLGDDGFGSTSGIIDAIDWALEKKYRVISMSLASSVNIGQKPSLIFEQIGQKALDQNAIIIAAAGNDSNRPSMPKPVSSPANANSIMAIGAVDNKQQVAYFSNGGINAGTGGKIDLVGPGVDVYSSYSKNAKGGVLYKSLNGTSMATPHLSGLAALYMQAFPKLKAIDIWKLMEKNALPIQNLLARDIGFGIGYYK